jgi:glycosyltransferase involved in cell wall biosynthesis
LRALRSREDCFDIFFENINWGGTGFLIDTTEEVQWMHRIATKTYEFKRAKGTVDIALLVTIPNEWERVAPLTIGVTAGIETTKMAPHWVEKCSAVDKIIVPSEHARYAFDNTSYDVPHPQTGQVSRFQNSTPIEVVHYPVKDTVPTPVELGLEYDFNFLAVAQWGPRKNLDNTMKWFLSEFEKEEVGLVVKANHRKNNVADRAACKERVSGILKDYPNRKCKIYLVHGNMTEEEMGGLYTHPNIKAIVSTSHGEGFGLPLFEAVYNELPVIAPNWSGHIDFLHAPKKDKKGKVKNRSHFTKIDYNIAPIQKEAIWEGVLQPDSQWCFPKESSCRHALREVYKNYGPRKSEAKKLAKYVKKNFSTEKTYKQLIEIVGGKDIEDFKNEVDKLLEGLL